MAFYDAPWLKESFAERSPAAVRHGMCEGPSNIDLDLDSTLLSEASVRESCSTPTKLQGLQISLLSVFTRH